MMLHIAKITPNSISDCEQKMQQGKFLSKEERLNHTGSYPIHNRFFSNGDKPWVILFNTKNILKLKYHDNDYVIQENEFVFFDDNVAHAWEMNNNDITIYFYRAKSDNPIKEGTYCIDNYFEKHK